MSAHDIPAVATIDVTTALNAMALGLEEAAALQEAMIAIAEMEDCPASLAVMARMSGKLLDDAMGRQGEIAGWCYRIDMDRIEREKLAADFADSDEGQALRDLSRDWARQVEQICQPAMRAITQMQNRAGEIDAMVRRARDMGGCLRWMHSPDRDPNKPEFGSLRATVDEAMAPRPGSLSAVMERQGGASRPKWDQTS